ncbi:MAG: hydrogenase maturation peptidase HycI [Acidobacteriota bacterium]|jgi:hydrogenase 3 maturation protease|nr:hydrogenase maturation peptidase HycI [Acidobacteriota bacterium]
MGGKLVLTVGSVLRGDDAAGPMLAKMLETRPVSDWEVIDGGQTPEDELSVVRRKEPDLLLLVDAADMGLEAGSIRLLDEKDVFADFLITTHSLPLTFLLKELKACCKEVVFLGIQPSHTEFFGALHPNVRKAVENIYHCLDAGGDIGHFQWMTAPA